MRNDLPTCNLALNQGAHGCKEGIQSTDQAYHSTYIGNHVFNSELEGMVCGGIGCVVVGNTCDACGQKGTSGGGALMYSYGGGAIPSTGSTATVGDAIFANNVVTNSSSATPLYCGSIQSANQTVVSTPPLTVTYENIKFSNNICSGVDVMATGSAGGFTNGFRFSNNNPNGNIIQNLSNVEFIGNSAGDNVTSPFKFNYSVGSSVTTGAVLMENNNPMPSPTYTSGFSTGAPTIAGGYPSFTLTIGSAPSSTGTLAMPNAFTGWTISCVDVNNATTTGGYYIKETANTATSVTVTGYNASGVATAWTTGDILHCQASPF